MGLFGIDLDGDGKVIEKDDMLVLAAIVADEEDRQSGGGARETEDAGCV